MSIPTTTLRGVESVRKRMGRSRSSIVAEAVEAWLAAIASTGDDRRYIEGYERYPEPAEHGVAAVVMGTWDDWGTSEAAPRRTRGKRGTPRSAR